MIYHKNSKNVHCFIINLDYNKERKENMLCQFEENDISFSFIDAVDGRKLNDKELETISSYEKMMSISTGSMSKGEIGCALSHIKAYREMIDKSIEYAMILEDDAVIQKNTKDILESLSDQFSSNEKIVVLLNHVKRYRKKNIIQLTQNYKIADLYDPTTMGAYGYFITLSAARTLYKNLQPVFNVADHWFYFSLYFIKVKVLIPHCIDYSQLGYTSSIDFIENRTVIHDSGTKIVRSSLKSVLARKKYQLIKSFYKSFRKILSVEQK